MLCSRGALASHLKLKWHEPGTFGALSTCITLAQSLRAVASSNHGCPSVHHSVATSVGRLGLVWVRDPGLTETVGQLWCLNPLLVCTCKGERGAQTVSASSFLHREFQKHSAES